MTFRPFGRGALVAILLSSGCGGAKPTNREPVYPVKGVITYKGRPATACDVTFFCKEKDRSAFGRTNEKGEFQLTTFTNNDGAVAGKHTVVVAKIEAAEPSKPVAPIDSPNYEPPNPAIWNPPVKAKNLLPTKYADVKTSDLIAVVNAEGGNEEMKLELKD